MKNTLIFFSTLFIFVHCQNNNEPQLHTVEVPKGNVEKVMEMHSTVEQNSSDPSNPDLVIDSLNIAQKGNYKIILKRTLDASGDHVMIDFFKKNNTSWNHIQHISIEKEGTTSLDAAFEDFNNDGYNDLTFRNGFATRGANELRTLFVFDKQMEKLVHIKNSNHYPNLRYNAELDCLDAWLVHGGSTTLFLRLEADSLKEFAGVSLLDTMEVFTIDDKGTRKILTQESLKDSAVYMRFSNYSPLKVNAKL